MNTKWMLGVVVKMPISFSSKLYLIKKFFMFKQVLGPSPLLHVVKKIHSRLFFRGGSENEACLSDQAFFEMMSETIPDKPPRLNDREVRELLSSTAKLTKQQRILKSILEEATLSRAISE